MKTYKLIACAFLAALAFILQVSNEVIGIPTGFGMTIDLAAVPVMLALFIFGAEYGFLTLMVLGAIILVSAPSGIVGSVMKVGATLPMLLIPYYVGKAKGLAGHVYAALGTLVLLLALFFLTTWIYAPVKGGMLEYFVGLVPIGLLLGLTYYAGRAKGGMVDLSNVKVAALALVLAVLVRGAVATLANLYFAGPVFFQTPPEAFMGFLDSLPIPFLGAGMGWFVIFFWNAVQGALEFIVAWVLAYKFGLVKRYGGDDA
jgi:riboflavin transporter FmnP